VARAKGELFETMSKDAVAVINNDDPLVRQIGEKFQGRKIRYGTSNDSDIRFAR
jgi:UDP-N-acetylmuramyl pentapeptide synthase